MTSTYHSVGLRMANELHPNDTISGRKSGYTVQDTISEGVDLMIMEIADGNSDEAMDEAEGGGIEQNLTVDDLMTSEM